VRRAGAEQLGGITVTVHLTGLPDFSAT